MRRPGPIARLLALVLVAAAALAFVLVWRGVPGIPPRPADVPIDHIIVIYLENRTFDHLYGRFPGANGLDQPGAQVPQVDRDGAPYATLPPPQISLAYVGLPQPVASIPPFPDPRFPPELPNAPFEIDQYAPSNQLVPTPVHRFYQHQLQMNGGRMDKFVAWTDVGALPMGYYDTTRLPLYPYARDYTLADNFFTAAFGGSLLNHFWLICACTPVWPDAPAELVSKPEYDAAGNLVGIADDDNKKYVTPDGYVVNTGVESVYTPHSPHTPPNHLLPPQTFPTIGDRLSAAGVSWAWYAGGWNDALAGHTDQPIPLVPVPPLNAFAYFQQYGDGTPGRAEHLKDESELLPSLDNGTLPAVTFVKPAAKFDEHPAYSTVMEAQQHAVELIEAVKASRYWPRTAIIITYDDYGGWYDHVAPPVVDRWGPGGRVPTLIISPYARKGYVDHTFYDTTSILRFIASRHGLQPLAERDARANNLAAAFDFSQPTPAGPRP